MRTNMRVIILSDSKTYSFSSENGSAALPEKLCEAHKLTKIDQRCVGVLEWNWIYQN